MEVKIARDELRRAVKRICSLEICSENPLHEQIQNKNNPFWHFVVTSDVKQ